MELAFAIDETACQNGEEALALFCEESQDLLYFFEATLLKFNQYAIARAGNIEARSLECNEVLR